MAYLEGEDGARPWNSPSSCDQNFDVFATAHPPGKTSFAARQVTKANLEALSCVRNATMHNDGDLSNNHDQQRLAKVQAANLPGVKLDGTTVVLEASFLEFTRLAGLAVRQYYGDA